MRSEDDGSPDGAAAATFTLIERAKRGDAGAVEHLFARYLPRMQRWARGRLPAAVRDLADTQDLVQETLIQTFNRLEHFEYRGEGALQAYIRQALLNRIRAEIRRRGNRPAIVPLEAEQVDSAPTPLEQAIGRQGLERYERALEQLRPIEREAIIARFELGMTYEELAVALQKPTQEAARKAAERAVRHLIEEMALERGDG